MDYVALGDSYASGVGAGAETGACRISDGAYPKLWTASGAGVVDLTMNACSGATSVDVRNKQLSGLDGDTDLVTVTMGANDLELPEAMSTCADSRQAQACAARLAAIRTGLTTTLPADIGRTTAEVAAAAGKAKIVLVGYPVPFEDVADCPQVPLPRSLRDAGNSAIAGVNQILQSQATAIGATYVDVTAGYAEHALCSANPWLVGVEGLSDGTVLHPTAQGQTEGHLPALTAGTGTPEQVLVWIAERDRPSAPAPSASPVPSDSPAPSGIATGAPGGSGGGALPITGTNIWWFVMASLMLLIGGVSAYRAARPSRIRTVSE